MPQAFGGIVLGQFGEVQTGGEMISNAVNDHGSGGFGQRGKAFLNGEHDALVERVALGGAVQANGQHRARALDLEQCTLVSEGGGGVSHRFGSSPLEYMSAL